MQLKGCHRFTSNRLVSNCAGTKEQSRGSGDLICIFLCFEQKNANYSPEPRLCSSVPAKFETSLFGWRRHSRPHTALSSTLPSLVEFSDFALHWIQADPRESITWWNWE